MQQPRRDLFYARGDWMPKTPFRFERSQFVEDYLGSRHVRSVGTVLVLPHGAIEVEGVVGCLRSDVCSIGWPNLVESVEQRRRLISGAPGSSDRRHGSART